MSPLIAVQKDITTLAVDAIVNAANCSLLGGGGVDGAIHHAAGLGLLAECKTLGGCETGEAKITSAYNLPCRHVIHTVGPVWTGGNENEADLLASCYWRSLTLAHDNVLRTVAFPAISTGIYGYPIIQAAAIAVKMSNHFITQNPDAFDEIIFCCFSQSDMEIYENGIAALRRT